MVAAVVTAVEVLVAAEDVASEALSPFSAASSLGSGSSVAKQK